MKRFASLATTALAATMFAGGSAAHATFTYNLVPISDINANYKPGAVIMFALTVTTTNAAITALSANSAIAFDDSVGDATGVSEATDQSLFPGKTTKFWNLPGPDSAGMSTFSAGTAPLGLPSTVDYFQGTPAHTSLKSGTTTLTVPVGTYTATTFTLPILANTTATSLTVILPSAYAGFPNNASNQDFVASKAGAVNAADQGIPAFGTASLTFKIGNVVPPVQLQGSLALEGVANLSAVSPGSPLGTFHFSFRTPGTTTERFGYDSTLTAGTGAFGTFTLTNVFAGNYDIAIKGAKNLRVVLPNWNTATNQNLGNITLPAGDANNDNSVDALDFNALAKFYGAVYDPNTSNTLTGYDPSADFNYDGTVDISDFNLLVGEFGNIGAP